MKTICVAGKLQEFRVIYRAYRVHREQNIKELKTIGTEGFNHDVGQHFKGGFQDGCTKATSIL